MKKKIKYILIGIILINIFLVCNIQKEKDLNKIKNNENIELAIYINEEETNTIPSKDSGYYYDREKSSCTNGAYINWDSVSWSPVVNNMNEYKTRCELHFTTTYTEGILNGTDPVLEEPLIPVTIESDGTVKKANLESEWYSYANKEWANAVILDDQYDTLNQNGKVHGATKEDGYVSFDGVDDYIDLGLENYDFGNEITLMVHLSINGLTQETQEILNNVETAGASIFYSDSNIYFEIYNENSNQYEYIRYDGINLGEEYTIVGIFNGNEMFLYVNGLLVNNLSINGTIKPSITPFFIGANPQLETAPINFSDINVKQVQIYNRAISEEEVIALNEGKVLNNEGLLKYIDFTNKSYENNEIIPEEKIESYFVWIPKYRYQLWDLGLYDSLTSIDPSKVHEIPIIFGDYNTSDDKEGECTTPMESGASGNCAVGDYMTHPAFLSIPSTGFWAGKFETGYNGATNRSEAEQNINDSSKIIVKPNTYSWRGIQVANAFYTSYNYQRNLDSHMMKNTEWGAVAYLQHSAYGSSTSVRINNNSDYITGYAANNEPTCGYTATNEECNRYCNDGSCNTAYPNSILASTTGNISGIYDMSGGAWEYIMDVVINEEGNIISGMNSTYNSGFNGKFSADGGSLNDGYDLPSKKYYDTYIYATVDEQYQRRILGDATGEMGPFVQATYLTQTGQIGSWYTDHAWFVWSNNSWFGRGAHSYYGSETGVFAFANTYGHVNSSVSFRVVLTP